MTKGLHTENCTWVAQIVDTHNVATKDKPTLFLSSINVAQGYKKADFMRKFIQFYLDQSVIIDLLLDRGFFAVNVIDTINDMGVDWPMPCTNTSRVVEALQGHKSGRRDAVASHTLTNSSGKTATFHMHITKRHKVCKKAKSKPQESVAPDCVRAANAEDELIGFTSSLTD